MGVHGLWELLSPVGRRVSVETLAGKTLAVDASIWMVQFMKAMRDEKGEVVRNAHLLGFFRRICKLLFLRTKPVFVFDGGTPALKRRTVVARRRQRENAQAKVRKTAEKMLLNHLKTLRLKELADDIKSQRMQKNSNTKGQNKSNQKDFVGSDSRGSHVKEIDEMCAAKYATEEDINCSQATVSTSYNQEELDEMLAASIAAEENGKHAGKGVPSIVINPSEEEHDAAEQILLPSVNSEVDIAVLAALPQSMQLDILAQLKGKKTEGLVKEAYNHEEPDVNYRGKGKGILLSEAGMAGCSSRHDNVALRTDNQDSIDEMLAASIALEENDKLVNNASTSVAASTVEEEEVDYDEDEEMILPAMHGEVDPLVLASLPPSMQLDLLVQMRERLIAENRQKYQKVKKDPAKFSELQIQAYLKTVAFRREINEVQKAAGGGGVEGVQTSRIASEANREYIFSSSFTGDKHELTSTSLEKNKSTQQKAQGAHPSQNLANSILAGNGFNKSSELVCNEPGEPAEESIQTYLDERGRFRVSRSRAMGMRMTRDIQRNLDLMKDFEQERAQVNKASNIGTMKNVENKDSSESSGIQLVGKSQEANVDLVRENVQNEQIMLDQNASIDISFEYGCENEFANGEDDIFSSLVGGNPVAIFGTNYTAATVQPSHSNWEEGTVEGKSTVFPEHDKVELKSSVAEEDNNNESEVEWEEGDCDGASSSLLAGKYASRGQLEEESNLQEAIRRSLEIEVDEKHKCMSLVDGHSNTYENKLDHDLEHGDDPIGLNENTGFRNNKNNMEGFTLCTEDIVEGKSTVFPEHDKVELKSFVAEEDNNNESEVEWEEGDCDGANSSLLAGKYASRGKLEEESNLQEAIRRSLEIEVDEKHKCMSLVDGHSNTYENKLDHDLEHGDDPIGLNENTGFRNNKNNMKGFTCTEDGTEKIELHEIEDGDKKHDLVSVNNAQTYHFHGSPSKPSVTFSSNKTKILIDTTCRWDSQSCSEDSISDPKIMMKDQIPVVAEKLFDKRDNGKVSLNHNNTSEAVPVGATEDEKKNYINESEPFSNSTDNTKPTIHLVDSSLKEATEDLIEPKFASDDNNGNFFDKRNRSRGSDVFNTPGDFPALATEVSLEEEIKILGQEYINLENEQRKLERNAESVNSELFTECQELLQMFGLPYIIAPMEAEAQCAYLELEKLVDGVVTDDSDVLLFGARSVYKNIFDDRKYVETYFMEDIEKELGLTREKIIRMALLLGSDYTEGVSGIGIVNAIEVLNAFPEEDGLLKFREWVESPDPTILGSLDAKSGSITRKKWSKVKEKINSINCDAKESTSEQNLPCAPEQNELPDYIQETKQTFFNKHRNVSKNWHIPSSFPSETVISAYCSPHVDKSTEPFTWGKPDHLVLRKFCWEKFGWIGQKSDELLLPVLKEYNKRETQLRLEAFYSFNERFAKIRSKRVKKAVKGITGKQPSDLINDSAEELSKNRKIGRLPEDSTLEISGGTDKSLESRRKSKIKQSTKRKNDSVAKEQSKKKKVNDDPSSAPSTSEMENLKPSTQTEEQCDGKALIRNTTGRGRRRGMGIKRGRDKENLSFESSSASSDIDDQGPRVHVDKVQKDVRKSLRSRKPVNYSFEDPEDEDADAFDQSNQTGPIEENLSQIHGASEDGETNHPSTGNHDSSDVYLKMGGGFCLDDGETDKLDTIDDVNTSTVDSTPDFSHFSDCLDESNRDKNSSDMLFSGTEKPENGMEGGGAHYKFGIEPNDLVNSSSYDHSETILKPENAHNNGGASAGAFSAMPFLKKRRKK